MRSSRSEHVNGVATGGQACGTAVAWRALTRSVAPAMYGHTVISTPASVRVNDREGLRSGA